MLTKYPYTFSLVKNFLKTSFWKFILVPFIQTRTLWIVTAWFAGYFFKNLGYPKYIERGYYLSRYFLLDIWARWDSAGYLSIVEKGYAYAASSDWTVTTSSLAFFPLYPYLIKLFSLLCPAAWVSRSVYLLIGVVLSNFLFLGALFIFNKLVQEDFSEETAHRSTLLLFLFPTSFFFSCFYPESLFLFLVVAIFYTAKKQKWVIATILSALLTLTRPQGVLIIVPLAWYYMEKRQWHWRNIIPDIGWFALIPIALMAHFYQLYWLTRDYFTPITAQRVWGRSFQNPFQNWVALISMQQTQIDIIDLTFLLSFLIISVFILLKFPSKAYGIYCLCMLALPLATGTYVSTSRHLALIFPVFIMLGDRFKSKHLFDFVTMLFFTLQILFFCGWVNYYWIS